MKKITNIKLVLLAVFAGLLFTMSTQAATFTVDRTDDATVSACTAAANDCTLRGAIAAANGSAAADVIQFDATVFNVPKTITLTSQLAITNNGTLTINGTGANNLTISGNNITRVFTIATGGNATINNLKVSNGNAGVNFGAGIEVNGTLTLNNSTIETYTNSDLTVRV